MIPSAQELTHFEDLTERLSHLTQTALYRACSASGLTPTQYFALSTLAAMGEPRMSQFATHLGLTPGACTTLVDRLVRQGWVERRTHPQDRRSVCIHVSLQGKVATVAATDARHRMTQEIYQGMAPDAQDQVRQSIEALVEAWQEYLRSSDDR